MPAVPEAPRASRLPGPLAPALLVLAVVFAACGGDNLFRDPLAGIGADRRPPSVTIEAPDSAQRVAIGDSILVRVRVSDDQALENVRLSGFALRGNPALGTETRLDRFVTKSVDLGAVRPMVRDTIITRYLIATADELPEDRVYLVATVRDLAGNEVADTVLIGIGGPRVAIASPLAGSEVRAGGELRVRLTAADTANRLRSVRLSVRGGLTADSVLRFEPPATSLDTIVTLALPADAVAGDIVLRAIARNTLNDTTVSPAVVVSLLAAAADLQPPSVRFRVTAPQRAETFDSVTVIVTALDDTRVERVGVTIIPTHRLPTGAVALTPVTLTQEGDSATFRVSLEQFGVPTPTDTSTVRLEVTGFALDAAGNCAAAATPNTSLSDPCASTDPVLGNGSGATYEILVFRGRTIRVGTPGDRIADLVADASRLFLSNLTRNRLEVVPIGGTAATGTIAVGSRPWGLAFNRARTLLYVANSGGTNISVVSPSAGQEVERIQTPNVKLYDVPFEARTIPDPGDPMGEDSVSALFPLSVTGYDYSDRPQFIGVLRSENLVYSTLPTAVARDGTLRSYDRTRNRVEILTDYAEDRVGLRVVIANADSAFLVAASPNNLIRVCPRNRSENPALDWNLPVTCMEGPVNFVQDTIERAGYDTRFLYAMDIEEIGLADTTFVAVSGDHSTVAFGEGARENGRVVSLTEPPGQTSGPLVRFGEARDLVNNTAERIVGLALNEDGSLGLARANNAFFFSRDLRLQGEVDTEPLGGGVDMHPDNPAVRRAFVSGVEPGGLPFIDVVDTFHFLRVARIFLRDPVTGPLRAVRTADGALKIYAVTEGGLVAVDVGMDDL